MKKIFPILLTICLILPSCEKNDFAIMGRQQIFLEYPSDGAVYAPTYGGYPIPFSWRSLRHYAATNFVFSLDSLLSNPVTYPASVTWQQSSLKSSILDSISAVLGCPAADTSKLWWKIETANPEDGWCEDVKYFYFKRFAMQTKQVMLDSPVPNQEFYVYSNYSKTLDFNWHCEKYITDYKLIYSTDREFQTNCVEVEMNEKTSYSLSERKVDDFLAGCGVAPGAKANIYWKVSGSGDIYIAVSESPRRTVKARRIVNDPVEFSYVSPLSGTSLKLDKSSTDPVVFSWSADTLVNYSFELFDAEFDRNWSVECGKTFSYSISHSSLDSVLSDTFKMVPGQSKKFRWSVVVTPDEAVNKKEDYREIIITKPEKTDE